MQVVLQRGPLSLDQREKKVQHHAKQAAEVQKKCRRQGGEESDCLSLSLSSSECCKMAGSFEAFLNDTPMCRNQGSPCQVGNRQEKGTCQRGFGLMTIVDGQWGTDQVPGSSFFWLKQRKRRDDGMDGWMGAEDGWEDSVDWSQGPPSLLCDGEARYRYDDVGAAGGGVLLCASACVRASVCVLCASPAYVKRR